MRSMEIKIAPQKVEKKKFIHNPKIKVNTNPALDVLRIETDDELTRIDFLYRNNYDYAGWAQIGRTTFIRVVGNDNKLSLVRAINIPIAPTKHFFNNKGELLAFTLYFPALPKGTKGIDIIESEIPGGTWFNFHNVSMETVWNDTLIINN